MTYDVAVLVFLLLETRRIDDDDDVWAVFHNDQRPGTGDLMEPLAALVSGRSCSHKHGGVQYESHSWICVIPLLSNDPYQL